MEVTLIDNHGWEAQAVSLLVLPRIWVLRKQHEEKGPSLIRPFPAPHHGSQSWGRRQSSRPPRLALAVGCAKPGLWTGPDAGTLLGAGRFCQQETLKPGVSLLPTHQPTSVPEIEVCHLIYAPIHLVSALGPAPHHQFRLGHSTQSCLPISDLSPSSKSLGPQAGQCCPGVQLICAGPVPV